MLKSQLILDLGSHSAKLYERQDQIQQLDVLTWELLEEGRNAPLLEEMLGSFIAPWKENAIIEAIGTAAMRRSAAISTEISNACKSLGITYRTISQKEEAELLRKAVRESHIPQLLDVMNVGGGSIQIIQPEAELPVLLPFGISDLNQTFHLLDTPDQRKVEDCTEWVFRQLPESLQSFAYTGGEKTYIESFGIQLNHGYCSAVDFYKLSRELASLQLDELESRSPFDSKWMRGAVASNCIVIAALKRSRKDQFLPSDLNIAHGFLKQV
ncbi:hypothetical protein [Paenibacillus rigui]|uniref:Exopolyphosphatase n=1 Tax=Paenibacillus rigui TaxID=554312 RepID=A0A229UV62_9BACL|nr:hypothetical protein [Paenibacillus rigui]OXM87233.1 exopolyphosphatase [Paenibacillus rigui]